MPKSLIETDYLSKIFNLKKFNEAIVKATKKLSTVEFDSIAVTGNSGTLFGGALSIATQKKLILVRKPNDSSHSERQIEGDFSGKNYIFVDDLRTTGTTEKSVINKINHDFPGIKYAGSYMYISNRLHKKPVKPLVIHDTIYLETKTYNIILE